MRRRNPQPVASEELRVEVFTLCEFARDEGRGRCTIVGTFDRIAVPAFPTTLRFDVVIRLRFAICHELQHSIAFHIVDPDGRPARPPMEGPLTLEPFEDHHSQVVYGMLRLTDWVAQHPGEYGIDLYVDRHFQARLPLVILSSSQAAGASFGG